MPRSSHPHGFLPFSTFPSPSEINSSTIPRSYNHSSDESETGSPSGAGPYDHTSSHGIQNTQEDTPFVPHRGHRAQYQQGGTRTDVALPPDTHSYGYGHGGIQDHNTTSAYPHRDRGAYNGTFYQSAHSNAAWSGDRDQWRASPGSLPDGHYRPQASYSPGQGYPAGAAGFPAGSPQPTYDLPRSVPSPASSQPAAYYDLVNDASTGLHPSAYESSPDADGYLRRQLNIPPYQRVDLWALPDPPSGQKPTQPLPILIKLAIHGSPRRKLTLREIYIALEERFSWFKENRHDKAWKGSIRHNLSLNKVFRNVPRPITEPGKGKYWTLDITGGEGYKRERKRRNKKNRSSDGDDDDDDDDPSDDEGTASSSAGSPGPSGISIQQQDPQSGVRRVRSSPRGTSPYGQSAAASSNTLSSSIGYSGGPIPSAGSSQSYHRVDPPSSQMSLGRTGFSEPLYRQPAFGQPSMGQGARSFAQQVVAHQGLRPGAVRAQTLPDAFSPSSGGFGTMASLQGVSPPGMMGPLSRSPTEIQQHLQGYDGGISGYNATGMNLSVNTPTQYGQGQYDMRMGMGRGSNNPNDQGSHGRGRTF